jgi:hypothetical protein
LRGRFLLSTDGFKPYADCVERVFGADIDYAQNNNRFKHERSSGRYSPPEHASIEKETIQGNPRADRISTSYVERVNLTVRMNIRRLTRLTNAFPRKLAQLPRSPRTKRPTGAIGAS